jgi:hypothetical protein
MKTSEEAGNRQLLKERSSSCVTKAGIHNHRRLSYGEIPTTAFYRWITRYGSLRSQGRQRGYFAAPHITSIAPLTIASSSARGVRARARTAIV